jgi:NAD(P)-dependent dehydrogenase (short-subunit alcohol dehydrogenase family)
MPSVLITGASKGIGRATAVEFAKRGYRVVATARDPRALEDLDVAERLRRTSPIRPASTRQSPPPATSTSWSPTQA